MATFLRWLKNTVLVLLIGAFIYCATPIVLLCILTWPTEDRLLSEKHSCDDGSLQSDDTQFTCLDIEGCFVRVSKLEDRTVHRQCT